MKFLKIFLSNVFVITALVIVLLTGVSLVLKSVTRHGESLTVPNIIGLELEKAEKVLAEKKLRYVITDSLFFEDKPAMSVLDQNPLPQSKVKEGRIVYITINSTSAPLVTFPNLIDVSLRQAQAMLLSAGLKAGELIYKPDIAENVVLDQLYQRRSIQPGTRIPKGSVIDLVLGNGLGAEADVPLPDLAGMTLDEARNLLETSSLTIGVTVYQGKIRDTSSATIFRQFPAYSGGVSVKTGQSVDVYLKQE